MLKRIASLSLIVLLATGVLSLVCIIHPVKAGTIAVPIDYARIQWAIGNASDGDRIEVRAGLYYENVVVDKRVTLVGEGRETTIIDGRGNEVTMRIRADNVSVSGFKITHGYKECLRFEGDLRFCTMFDNEISFANERGIWVNHGANNSIHDNLVHDWGRYGGIDVVWSHNNTIFNNVVYSSMPGWWGLSINNGTNNQMYNNTVYSSSFGIFVDWSAANNSIFNNTFRENSIGVGVTGSSRENSFWGNQILRNGLGIAVMNNAAENTFSNNTISDSGTLGWGPTGGISLSYSTGNHLRNNVFTNNNVAFQVSGDSLEHYMQDIDLSNSINGKPIRYLLNQHDISIKQESGLVALVNSTNTSVEDLVISNSGVGILLAYTNNSIVRNITTSHNGVGIDLVMSNDNVIIDNNATGNLQVGICLSSSGGNRLRGNKMTNNSYNFWVRGVGNNQPTFEQMINDVDISNTVNGKPIYYWVNESNRQIPNDAGGICIINSTNIIVQDVCVEQNGVGLGVAYSNHVSIRNVTTRGNFVGVAIAKSNQCLVNASKIENNIFGIVILNSSDNNAIDNRILGVKLLPMGPQGQWTFGIAISNCTGTMVAGNTVANSSVGVFLEGSTRNELVGNNVAENSDGLMLQTAHNNSIIENNVSDNSECGIRFFRSFDNFIYHNNLVSNTQQLSFEASSGNTFDDGCEGNYWSSYNGADSDGDGVGDTPYIIDSNIIDTCPLMNRYWNSADINHDLKADLKDVYRTAMAYGSYPGHPKWNPHCDVNEDGTVDLRDYYTVCKGFGKSWQ